MYKTLLLIFFAIIAGALGGILGTRILSAQSPAMSMEPTSKQRMAEHYASEMATMVSPATIKKWIDDGTTDYILVDLRSQAEYTKEHFQTAINIPAVSLNEEQLVAEFRQLPEDKPIIVHCYSAYCTLGRQVGEALARHGIYVKELTVGWSELRYHYGLWNPGAAASDGEKYIVKGSTDDQQMPAPCVEGEFGC